MGDKRLTLDKINAVKKSAPLQETERSDTAERKKGRPAKAPVEVKNKRIQSYYTEEEHSRVKAAAKAAGMTLGAFQREIILKAIENNQGEQNDYTN